MVWVLIIFKKSVSNNLTKKIYSYGHIINIKQKINKNKSVQAQKKSVNLEKRKL